MAIVSSSKKTKFTKCRQARPTGFGVLRRLPPYRCYPVDGLRLGLRVLIRLIFICWHCCPVRPAARPRLSVTVGLGLSGDHRVPESDSAWGSGSARWHTAAAMTVPQCCMGRGLTTDERAGTDTLSEAWLAQRLFTGTSHRDGPTRPLRQCHSLAAWAAAAWDLRRCWSATSSWTWSMTCICMYLLVS